MLLLRLSLEEKSNRLNLKTLEEILEGFNVFELLLNRVNRNLFSALAHFFKSNGAVD